MYTSYHDTVTGTGFIFQPETGFTIYNYFKPLNKRQLRNMQQNKVCGLYDFLDLYLGAHTIL